MRQGSRFRVVTAERTAGLIVAAASIPIVVGLISAGLHGWRATGDYAHTELAVRDVPRHLPLIGVAGRFGPFDNQHAHPGPAMAYVFAPMYRLFGSSSFALLAATAMVHIFVLALAVRAARSIGGRSAATAMAVAGALLFRSLGNEFFLTPWNPWMPVVAFFAFLASCVAVTVGRRWWLPVATALACYCSQTHISYLVLVCGVLGTTIVVAVMRFGRTRESFREWIRPAVVATAIGVIAWLPVAYDQLRRTRNFGWLVGRFTHACDPRWWGDECAQPVGFAAALKALSVEVNAAGGWLIGGHRDPALASFSPLFVLTLGVVGIVGYRVFRTQNRNAQVALGLLVVAGILAVLSGARILGDFYDYVIRWSWPLAASASAIVVWAAWCTLTPGDRQRLGRVLSPLAFAVGLLISVPSLIGAVGIHAPYDADSRIVAALGGGVVPSQGVEEHYLVRWHDPAGLGGVGFGLVLELEKRGLRAGTDSWTRFAVGNHRVLDPSDVTKVLFIAVGDQSIKRYRAQFGVDPIERFDPRSVEDQRRSAEARALIEARLTELGRTDLLDRIDEQFGNASLIAAESELPDDVNRAVSIYTDLRLPAALFELLPESGVLG